MSVVSFKKYLSDKTIMKASWNEIAYAAYYNLILEEDHGKVGAPRFDKEDHNDVLHYIDNVSPSSKASYRTIYDDVNGGTGVNEFIKGNHARNIAAQILLLWGWWFQSKKYW
jgi:hypothetical protein